LEVVLLLVTIVVVGYTPPLDAEVALLLTAVVGDEELGA
jgi:hypothetical protein